MTLSEDSSPEEVMKKLMGAVFQTAHTIENAAWAQKLAAIIQADTAIKTKQHLETIAVNLSLLLERLDNLTQVIHQSKP